MPLLPFQQRGNAVFGAGLNCARVIIGVEVLRRDLFLVDIESERFGVVVPEDDRQELFVIRNAVFPVFAGDPADGGSAGGK